MSGKIIHNHSHQFCCKQIKKGRVTLVPDQRHREWISRLVSLEAKQQASFRSVALSFKEKLVVFSSRSLSIYFCCWCVPALSCLSVVQSALPDSVPESQLFPSFNLVCQPHLPCSDAYLSPTSKPPCLLFSQYRRRPIFLLHLSLFNNQFPSFYRLFSTISST